MKKERMKILTMLEEGKITFDEATKLFETLNLSIDECEASLEERAAKIARSLESLTKDLGEKLDHTKKDMEPKLKSATKKILKKTSKFVDDISKSLNESLSKMESEECEDCGKSE